MIVQLQLITPDAMETITDLSTRLLVKMRVNTSPTKEGLKGFAPNPSSLTKLFWHAKRITALLQFQFQGGDTTPGNASACLLFTKTKAAR